MSSRRFFAAFHSRLFVEIYRGLSHRPFLKLLSFFLTSTVQRNQPDDRWLSYQSDESGRWKVYVQAFPDATRNVQVSTDGGARPRWNPNGKELFYLEGNKLTASASNR